MNYSNGRVDIKSPNTSKLFNMYDKNNVKQCVTFRNPTLGLWNESPLSNCFFSKENIQIIQNGIRAGVYKKSNNQYMIADQDYDSLTIIMRSFFLQYAVHKINNIQLQIKELNQMVLNYCIESIYGEAQGYIKYLYDASTLVVPISHPVMANNTDKELVLKSWF
jgi:hypothetical protein